MKARRGPRTSAREARRVVAVVARRGLPYVDARGHRWVFDDLGPALEASRPREPRAQDEEPDETAAACALACYVLGDLHELHGAPLAALSWFERSIALVPTGAAWRELGARNLDLGRIEVAREALEAAQALDPEDDFIASELDDLAAGVGPVYVDGDPTWRAAEALAVDRPGDALAALHGLSAPAAGWGRALARAAQGDTDGVLAELVALGRGPLRVTVPSELWFFLPERLWSERAFWQLLCDLGERLDPCSSVPRRHALLPATTAHDATPAERVRLQLRALESPGP